MSDSPNSQTTEDCPIVQVDNSCNEIQEDVRPIVQIPEEWGEVDEDQLSRGKTISTNYKEVSNGGNDDLCNQANGDREEVPDEDEIEKACPCSSDTSGDEPTKDENDDPCYTPEISKENKADTDDACIPPRKKRKYNYNKREKRSTAKTSERQVRFARHAALDDDTLSNQTCCARKKCFQVVNKNALSQKSKEVMSMKNVDRRRALHDMLDKGNVFMFDGRPVCATFLSKAFKFSRDLQCSVKGTEKSWTTRRQPVTKPGKNKSNNRDAIVVFLRRIADQTGNSMPEKEEIHLPFYDKKEVYGIFCKQ